MNCYIPSICSNERWITLFLSLHCKNTAFDQRIFIVPRKLKTIYEDVAEGFERISVLEEDDVAPGLKLEVVSTWLKNRGADPQRAGWYFQQFLKMGIAKARESGAYAVWDIDTLPVNPVALQDQDGFLFIKKREYHLPYFQTISALFDGKLDRWESGVSFVAEAMVFDSDIMREILRAIASSSVVGESPFEKIMNAIPVPHVSKSGFSEFELYGNYVMRKHPDRYKVSNIRTLRIGAYILPRFSSGAELDWVSQSFEIVTIEDRSLFSFKGIFKIRLMRKAVSARQAAKVADAVRVALYKTAGRKAIRYDWF